MIYEKMSYLSRFWADIITVLDTHYGEGEENTVVLLGCYLTVPIEKFRKAYPDKKLVIYQTEPLSPSHWWGEAYVLGLLSRVDEIWEENFGRYEKLLALGYKVKFKPLQYTEALKRVYNRENPDIDVLFYGSITEARGRYLHSAMNRFTNLIAVYNIDGPYLDELIGRSKIVLNLRTTDNLEEDQKHARLFYLLINNKCVISHPTKENFYGDLIIQTEDLMNTTWQYLRDGSWRTFANGVSDRYKELCQKEFGKIS